MANPVTEPKGLLRRKIDEAEVTTFLASIDPKTKVIRTQENEPRWISKDGGMVLYADDEKAQVTDVFLYAEGHEGYKQYRSPLPYGLDFSLSKQQVQAKFSLPPKFTGPQHDTWDFDDHRIIVSYGKNGRITTVTLTTDF